VSRPPRVPLSAGRLGTLAAGLVLAVLALTGCGGSATPQASSTGTAAQSTEASTAPASGTDSSTAGSDGTLTATETDFHISLSTKTPAAGPYLVRVDNKGSSTHNLTVERNGSKVAGTSDVSPGESASLSVTLKPGKYVFYCGVDGHRQLGMEVTVTVS
jgi:uncharacterized cupredoxin-like copper-binding protein